jgi:hypothetical protein
MSVRPNIDHHFIVLAVAVRHQPAFALDAQVPLPFCWAHAHHDHPAYRERAVVSRAEPIEPVRLSSGILERCS